MVAAIKKKKTIIKINSWNNVDFLSGKLFNIFNFHFNIYKQKTNEIYQFYFSVYFYFSILFSSELPEIFLSLLLISFHHWYYPILFLEGKILLLSRYDNLEDIHVYTLHFWMCQCLWLCQKLLLPFAAFTVSSELAGSQIGYWFFFL